jgi:hypothetical protein
MLTYRVCVLRNYSRLFTLSFILLALLFSQGHQFQDEEDDESEKEELEGSCEPDGDQEDEAYRRYMRGQAARRY